MPNGCAVDSRKFGFFSLGIPYFYTFKFRNAKLVSQREVWGQLSPIEKFLKNQFLVSICSLNSV